jgi:hypothetical protein
MIVLSRETGTGVYLATSEEVEGVSGRFFERIGDERPLPVDGEAARRLWEIGESLVGEAPPLQ